MSAVLITGADGHVGQALARALLLQSDSELLLYVRANTDAEFHRKQALLGTLVQDPRCRVIRGDLRKPEPFSRIGRSGITRILHCAAVTDFGVERETARSVNIDGTKKLADFAATCVDLQRFGFVSSLYAAGLRDGAITEQAFDDSAPFANHYEWSKWHAEKIVHERSDLPWQIFRVATILSDDMSGSVVQQNVIHNTLRLLYYGLLSVIPGNADTRVYMTTTDFVVECITSLLRTAGEHRIFNISNSGTNAMTLGALADTAYAAFLRDARFAKQGILKPLFCDQDSFRTLVAGMDQLGGAMAQALQSVAPFAPQLYSDKNVCNNNLLAALRCSEPPETRALLEVVSEHLIESRWGLNSVPRSRAS
jgi:nucleoside-diphosphate-sugar epimerase